MPFFISGAAMPKIAGYGIITDPENVPIELDFQQCCHCGGHFPKPKHAKEAAGKALTPIEAMFFELEGKRVTGHCHNCNGPICSARCMACVPFERQLDESDSGKNPTAVSVGMGGIVMPPPLAPM